MHMADALLSPAVGGAMWAATAVTVAYCARKVRDDLDESKIPLMGVAGAFVFAAQMLNFTIPATGSSGHLGGALMLAILLGPEAAFLVIASVLAVQALFFADGGLLALGANIFNLGFFPAFVAYPLIYRRIVGDGPAFDRRRVIVGSMLAAIVGLQLGAFAVVLETTASGITELPFSHLPLADAAHPPRHRRGRGPRDRRGGAVRVSGAARAAHTHRRAQAARRAAPQTGAHRAGRRRAGGRRRCVVVRLGQRRRPRVVDRQGHGDRRRAQAQSATHEKAAELQEKTAILPDYSFKDDAGSGAAAAGETTGTKRPPGRRSTPAPASQASSARSSCSRWPAPWASPCAGAPPRAPPRARDARGSRDQPAQTAGTMVKP